MGRSVRLQIGVNGAFITRRWEKPENMMRLTAETGFACHEFCADVIDPFFMGPRDFLLEMAAEVRAWAAHYGVYITDIYTGMATHRFHSFGHSRPEPGQRMREWLDICWDLCLAMGTDRWGGHVDAVPAEAFDDPAAYEAVVAKLQHTWREMAVVAGDKGLGAIYVEQMYTPGEVPWTLAQQEDFLIATNQDREGVPVYTTVDVGHMAGMHYGLAGEELDYRAWLRRFAPWSEIIHMQQTTPDGSHHWPFTPAYNERGHISVEAVLEAIQEGHAAADKSPVSEVLEPVDRHFLIFEIIPGSTKREDLLLEEMRVSAEYLHGFVPKEGMELTI
jgi:hypothetical protein